MLEIDEYHPTPTETIKFLMDFSGFCGFMGACAEWFTHRKHVNFLWILDDFIGVWVCKHYGSPTAPAEFLMDFMGFCGSMVCTHHGSLTEATEFLMDFSGFCGWVCKHHGSPTETIEFLMDFSGFCVQSCLQNDFYIKQCLFYFTRHR